MAVFKTPAANTGYFGKLFSDYINGKPELRDFYNEKPELSSFEKIIRTKSFPLAYRKNLVNVLSGQYCGIEITDAVKSNIEKLGNEGVFTVVTGHQLNLATGPLYFIYKILTIINLAEELKNAYPQSDFVPLFWMASEDHDLDEIKSFRLFGKPYSWETDQKGPVGRMNIQGLEELVNQLPEKSEILLKAYAGEKSLSTATRILINELFGKYGLVILDADHPVLKKEFAAVLEQELKSGEAGKLFGESTEKLKYLGYETQVFPRDINLFLFDSGDRKRISKENGNYKALPDSEFSEGLMLQHLSENPENFSPNVLMRPLYQETILPNIAYIGGAAEIDYWLQTKAAFDKFNIDFPVLLPRNFVMYIDEPTVNRIENLQLSVGEILQPVEELKKICLERKGIDEVSIEEELTEIAGVFDKLKNKAGQIDKSLEPYVLAEGHKLMKELSHIEKKLKKSQDQKHETLLRQVEKVKEKLFPGNKLQERSDNVFSFLANDPEYIDRIKTYIQPFDFSFKIVTGKK
jgi:bacillithiol biosynthesis cysteine-adding enzyme BshC